MANKINKTFGKLRQKGISDIQKETHADTELAFL